MIRTFVDAMEEKEIQYDFRNVPPGWQLCFLDECPKKDLCLRQLVGRHLTGDRDFGPAVYPTIKRNEEGCWLFADSEPKSMAWGLRKIFSEVKSRDELALRNQIKQYLGGHSNYYRYHNGERLLSPEKQEWIINLFQKYGYSENLEFDHYTLVYDFSQ